MSKPAALVVSSLLGLGLLAALVLLLSAEMGSAFQLGTRAWSGAGSSARQPARYQQLQQRQQQPSRSLLPRGSTTEDKADAAAPVPPAADSSASPTPVPSTIQSEAPAGPCKKFPNCDGSMRGKGCDGMGKIQGGIATVPGLGWWPIKAYRPCPAAIDAGYGYKRKGQTFGEFIEGKRRPDEEE